MSRPRLSTALISNFDGVVGADALDTALVLARLQMLEHIADSETRFRALSPGWQDFALDGMLAETVRVEVEGPEARVHARIRAGAAPASLADGFAETPLMRLRRPAAADLAQGAALVRRYADLRGERQAEIAAQLHDIVPFFAALDWIDAVRTPWTLMILRAGLRFAAQVTHRFKFGLACPRPILFSPQIHPIISTPTHGTLPSGHATEAHLLATLLARLNGADPLAEIAAHGPRWRLAARIAANRTVAGVHFAVDSACGAVLGLALGEHLAACGAGGDVPKGWVMDARHHGGRDFHYGELARIVDANDLLLKHTQPAGRSSVDPLFEMVWRLAEKEWAAPQQPGQDGNSAK